MADTFVFDEKLCADLIRRLNAAGQEADADKSSFAGKLTRDGFLDSSITCAPARPDVAHANQLVRDAMNDVLNDIAEMKKYFEDLRKDLDFLDKKVAATTRSAAGQNGVYRKTPLMSLGEGIR